jgi:hypothetical protein
MPGRGTIDRPVCRSADAPAVFGEGFHDWWGGVVEGVGDEGRWWSAAEPGFWQQVVGQLGTALIVVDTAGRFLAVNPAAERHSGSVPDRSTVWR